jgi:cytoplasmic iron level regulating protein YaaA (DUF328/UPF0246 family)
VTPYAILLPPSETKSLGGDGPPLHLEELAFDAELSAVRKQLVDAVTTLASDVPASRAALGLSEHQDDQVALNADVWTGPTLPALRRYTGVLYDALDYRSLSPSARRKAHERVLISSALFGLVRGGDPVPAYRLSAGSALPGLGTLGAVWRPALARVLASFDGLVIDLRSSSYAALAPAAGAVTVRVLSVRPDGSRSVVSHFNKHHKGVLVRTLLSSRATPHDVPSLLRLVTRAGIEAERSGPARIDVLVPAESVTARR